MENKEKTNLSEQAQDIKANDKDNKATEKQVNKDEKRCEEKGRDEKQDLSKEIENLKAELIKAEKEKDEYKDKWMRNVAEFDNYKKRNAKLWQDAFNEGKADVIVKILPVGDNLDIALNLNLDEKTAEGIRLIKKKFLDVLKSMGVEEVNPEGQPFDPNIAEAIMQVEKEEGEESDIVKQVFEKGYKMQDKIIRYAKCSVIK